MSATPSAVAVRTSATWWRPGCSASVLGAFVVASLGNVNVLAEDAARADHGAR